MRTLPGFLLWLVMVGSLVVTPVGWAQANTPTRPQIININTASQAQLEALPGIGPKIAREIIRNRPYRDSKELQTKVKGIGPKTWEQIKRYVRFR